MIQEFARKRFMYGLVPFVPLGQDLALSTGDGRWPGAVRLAMIGGIPILLWAGIARAAGLI